GDYEVQVRAHGFASTTVAHTIALDDPPFAVPLEAGGALSGVVVDGSSAPVKRAVVSLVERTTKEEFVAFTGADGSWSATSLPDGIYDGWINDYQNAPAELVGLVPT